MQTDSVLDVALSKRGDDGEASSPQLLQLPEEASRASKAIDQSEGHNEGNGNHFEADLNGERSYHPHDPTMHALSIE